VTSFFLAVAIGAVVFLAAQLVLNRIARARIKRQVLGAVRREEAAAAPDGGRLVARFEGLFGATERRLGGTRGWAVVAALLARADVRMRAVELVWLVGGGGLAAGILLALASGSLLAVVWAPLLAAAVAYAYLALRAARRLRSFDAQLPDLLGELAASLRAGHSLSQGLQVVADDAAEPARAELQRVLAETRLGRPLEEALDEMATRLPSAELRYVLSAVAVQRQVGGSLASLFDLVAETVQQRQRFERKVRSLTASGRLSAAVLIAMPFALALLLSAINHAYLSPLFQTSTGRVLVVGGLVLMGVGAIVLKRIVSIKGVTT
jgi:tight adherence protein B